MKNTIYAMALMAVMISFASCGGNGSSTTVPTTDSTSIKDSAYVTDLTAPTSEHEVADSTTHAEDTTSAK